MRVEAKLDEAATEAIETVKNVLQAQIELYQPDFKRPFDLTTDASDFVIGAVLSRNIAFISRTINETG